MKIQAALFWPILCRI